MGGGVYSKKATVESLFAVDFASASIVSRVLVSCSNRRVTSMHFGLIKADSDYGPDSLVSIIKTTLVGHVGGLRAGEARAVSGPTMLVSTKISRRLVSISLCAATRSNRVRLAWSTALVPVSSKVEAMAGEMADFTTCGLELVRRSNGYSTSLVNKSQTAIVSVTGPVSLAGRCWGDGAVRCPKVSPIIGGGTTVGVSVNASAVFPVSVAFAPSCCTVFGGRGCTFNGPGWESIITSTVLNPVFTVSAISRGVCGGRTA